MEQTRLAHGILICAISGVFGCGHTGVCESADEPCELVATFDQVTVEPGQELVDLCQSFTLNNPDELWVNEVRMENAGGYHHSNWFFVPDDAFAVPDGAWPCSEHEFTELAAAVLGGYLFAQTTQSTTEVQRFAQGAAIRLPPYARIIGATHLLNATDQTLATRISLSIASTPARDVTVKLVPGRITYQALEIPARSRAEFTTECDLAATYQQTMAAPLRFSIYHVLPHYHALGVSFQFEILGGPRDGEVLYRHDGYGGDNFGHTFDPPVDLAAAGASGIRFTCGFDNPRGEPVGWGVGDQEMCVTAVFADTDMGFDGDVAENQVLGTAADGTIQNTGPCALLGVPWSHDRPGGPPR